MNDRSMATDGKYGHMTSLRRKPGVIKADKRRRNANEVIVYLDDYIYSTDNVYQTVYLDFRTDKDLAAFKDAIGSSDEETRKYLEHKDEGYLEITNYHSSKRLTSGAYYALNVKSLKKLRAEQHRDHRLLLLSYNLDDCNDDFLLPHGELEPDKIEYDEPLRPELPDSFLYEESLKLKVNNVGQANWNEIISNDKVIFVYDMGAPISASIQDVRGNYIEKYAQPYQQDAPWLIISHWDKDHIHGLCVMSDDELKCFKGVICPFYMRSVVSKRLFARLKKAVGFQRMYSYKNRQRDHRYDYPRLQRIFENHGIWLFLGEESRNINYSGIVMVVSGNNSHAVLTGDCLNIQACYATRYSRFIGGAAKRHILVMPHHGGKFKKQKVFNFYRLSGSTHPRKAVVSVGKDNPYKHPDGDTLSYFKEMMYNPIDRTDEKGSIIEPLSKDVLEDIVLENEYRPDCVQDLMR